MSERKPHISPDAAIVLAYRIEQKIAPQERDDGWTDPDTGEWVSMPSEVRALIQPHDAEEMIAALRSLVEQLEAAQQIERVVRDDYYAMARHYGDAPEEWWPQLWTVLNDSNPATRPDGPEYDERVSELDIPGAEAGWTGAPDPACSHPDASFDRSLCGMCGSMHYFCTECGAQTDECSPALSPEHRPDCGRRDDHEAPRECAVD